MRPLASTRPRTASRAARFTSAVLAFVWTLGGGLNVAHADMRGMPGMPGMRHTQNPVEWISATGLPFLCHDGVDQGITVAGAGATGGPLAAGPGLAVLLVQASAPTPEATQSIEMTLPSTGEIGPMPNVNEEDLRKVTDNLLCQCGCGLTVAACELAMTCDVSKEMKYQAAVYIAPKSEGGQGMTPEQALDQFAKDFGERVLAAPTKSGFNLTAWILPFVGMGVGVVLVGWALITWKSQQVAPEQVESETDVDMLSRIEDEVRKGM